MRGFVNKFILNPNLGTRDGFGLGTERNLMGFPRYHMIGTDDEGMS